MKYSYKQSNRKKIAKKLMALRNRVNALQTNTKLDRMDIKNILDNIMWIKRCLVALLILSIGIFMLEITTLWRS